VTVEDKRSLERLNLLRPVPAKLRFVSFEPLLEDLGDGIDLQGFQWSIIGGESGANARPLDYVWIRKLIQSSRRQNVKVCVKQVGQFPFDTSIHEGGRPAKIFALHHRSGADPSEWPADLQIQERPEII
jgi:protein gp37